MIIKFGKEKHPHDYGKDVFVSCPYFKIVFNNGLGIYILNSYKFNFVPRFYFNKQKDFFEGGVFLFNFMLDVMWNKSFKITK